MTKSVKNLVVDTLKAIAALSELAGQNPFKTRAFVNAARTLEAFEGDISQSFNDGTLATLPGIGKGVLQVVGKIVRGESVTELVELKEIVPESLLELTQIPGLGPKRVRMLWQDLQIKNLGELEYAIQENRLDTIKGFGPKLVAGITESIHARRKTQGHMRLDQALAIFQALKDKLLATPGVQDAEMVGALARLEESMTEIAIAVLGLTPENRAHDGEMVVLHSCDDPARWGAFLVWHTSEPAFLKKLTGQASRLGFNFEEDGLLKNGQLVSTPSDEAFFQALGLAHTPAERRQGSTPLVLFGQARPKLIELKDLRGAFHNHTTASDGKNSLEEMHAKAMALGLSYMSINDHSQSAFYAHGLKNQELLELLSGIEKINEKKSSCYIFSGTESDILQHGELDYPDDYLDKLDVVIGSVHSRLKQNHDEMTTRLVNACENPRLSILGHPTGRLILDRPPSNFDMTAVMTACKTNGCAMELNANPHRLDLSAEHLGMAKEMGIWIAINADAHSTYGLEDLGYGIMIARRAGLTKDDVLNCLELNDITLWLKQRRERV